MDVRTLMRRSAEHHADLPCVGQGTIRYSFEQSWIRALRFANWLLSLGLEKGDRVGVLEDNTIESADFFVGTALAGLVRVPLYARNSISAHEHMLAHTGCRAVVVSANYAHELEGMMDRTPCLEHVLVRGEDYERELASFPASDPDPRIDESDWYVIRHTGGTTGPAKGVGYTHRSWLNAIRDWTYALPPLDPRDVIMHFGPISHGSGYLFLPAWLQGASNVLQAKFDAGTAVELLVEERVSMCFMVPTMLNMIVNHPASTPRDFPDLKCIVTAAAPISDDTARSARALFGERLWQLYGLTEAIPASVMSPKVWFGEYPGSSPMRATGKIYPFAEVEIWEIETRAKLAPGEEGEIVIRVDGQMSGFWEDLDATDERLVDGWVLTGDIGAIDRNGFLYLLDRKDDMIISGGFNIWPAELENVLMEHPAVLEAVAFGIPDERWGEVSYAHVQVTSAGAVAAEELIALCAERLGSYKKPKGIDLQTSELLKSPVGKLQRKLLREPYWAGHDRRVSGS